MKSLVVYYSHSGNTAYVANKIAEHLRRRGEIGVFELSYREKKKGFLGQLFDRFVPMKLELSEVPTDISAYDCMCIGIPVWGGRPAPLATEYIKECKNITGKKILCFQVYGIESSAISCFKYVKAIFEKKGSAEIFNLNINWVRIDNEEFVDNAIRETLDKICR